jgi:putative oxidoreductase
LSAIPRTSPIARPASSATYPVRHRLDDAEAAARRWLVAHSITILRVSLGAVFLAFGLLKFFPGESPAQDLVERTTAALTLGFMPGGVALVAVALLESVIGICLVSGRGVRPAVYLLALAFVGILSPLVVLPGRLFAGPHGAPTLEGQYVLKDVVLVGAALVIAAAAGGARLEHAPD